MNGHFVAIAFLALCQAALIGACQSSLPVTPSSANGAPDSGCAVLEEIALARLIRTDAGVALAPLCDAGAP